MNQLIIFIIFKVWLKDLTIKFKKDYKQIYNSLFNKFYISICPALYL